MRTSLSKDDVLHIPSTPVSRAVRVGVLPAKVVNDNDNDNYNDTDDDNVNDTDNDNDNDIDNDNNNDNDHSFSQLFVHKALTCPEGQSGWVEWT